MSLGAGRKYNWKKYDQQGRIRFYSRIACLTVLIFIVMIIASKFVFLLRDSMTDSLSRYMYDSSYQAFSEVQGRLDKGKTKLDSIASGITPYLESGEEEMVEDILAALKPSTGNSVYCVIRNDGSTLGDDSVSAYVSEIRLRLKDDGDSFLMLSDGSAVLYTYLPAGEVLVCYMDRDVSRKFFIPSGLYISSDHCTVITDTSSNVLVTDVPEMSLYSHVLYGRNEEKVSALIGSVKAGTDDLVFLQSDEGDIAVITHRLKGYDLVFINSISAALFVDGMDTLFAALAVTFAVTLALFALLVITVVRYSCVRTAAMTEAAFIDPVTGGLNMAGLIYQTESLTGSLSDSVVIMLSLRNYTISSGSMNMGELHRLLRITMESLLNHTAADEHVCRTSGEQFLLVLRKSENEQLEYRIRMMAATAEREFNANMSESDKLSIAFAAGVYSPEKDESIAIAAEKVRIAGEMAAWSVNGGTVFVYYDEALINELTREKELTDSFSHAMDSREFEVFYQPKVDIGTGSAVGAEALVRWQRNGRTVCPADFIPVFEKNGYIISLDLYVIGEVCSELRRSIALGHKVIPVAVNLSRRHFAKSGIADEIEKLRSSYSVPAGMLEIEITESIFLDRTMIRTVREELEKLHEYGYRCTLDDFGSGFSSLGLLTDFPIDCLKIDKSFMDGIFSDKTRMVVSSIINLASSLSIDVVAEGVENSAQLDILKEIGGRVVQGYVYSRPMTCGDWRRWLDEFGGDCPKILADKNCLLG